MAYVVLLAFLATAGAGILSLLAWLRRRRSTSRFPVRLVVSHVVTATTALAFWGAFLITGGVGWAWAAFAVLNVSNGLGDAILTGRFRHLTGLRSAWWRDYRRAVGLVLKGRHPRVPTLHALAAGVTYFSTLAVCLLVT